MRQSRRLALRDTRSFLRSRSLLEAQQLFCWKQMGKIRCDLVPKPAWSFRPCGFPDQSRHAWFFPPSLLEPTSSDHIKLRSFCIPQLKGILQDSRIWRPCNATAARGNGCIDDCFEHHLCYSLMLYAVQWNKEEQLPVKIILLHLINSLQADAVSISLRLAAFFLILQGLVICGWSQWSYWRLSVGTWACRKWPATRKLNTCNIATLVQF